MKCCSNCFSSDYIKSIINTNSSETGECGFCGSTSVNVFLPSALSDFFKSLLDLYVPIYDEDIIARNSPSTLLEQLDKDFHDRIFNHIDISKQKELLLEIVKKDIEDYNELFNHPVFLKCIINRSETLPSELFKISWKEFIEEIKYENRFHISHLMDLNKLEVLFKRHVKEYKKGKVFYRSRLSDKSGFLPSDLSCPPPAQTKAGRANPEGIPYLYLSDSIETTIYEIRASLYDFITIGQFILKEDVTILNLRETEIYDPLLLAENEDLEDFLLHLPFINHLGFELSKPVRRIDNLLDYLPTQYLSEFAKSKKYDGIEYRSSLNTNGFNIAAFDKTKYECINTEVREIQEIKYMHVNISN